MTEYRYEAAPVQRVDTGWEPTGPRLPITLIEAMRMTYTGDFRPERGGGEVAEATGPDGTEALVWRRMV